DQEVRVVFDDADRRMCPDALVPRNNCDGCGHASSSATIAGGTTMPAMLARPPVAIHDGRSARPAAAPTSSSRAEPTRPIRNRGALPLTYGCAMSWDVRSMRLPAEIRTYDDLESYGDDPMLPLGQRADVIRQISAVFEGTDWSDPAWGVWSGKEGSIEFNLGDDDEIESVMLHVRADDAIVVRIVRLAT